MKSLIAIILSVFIISGCTASKNGGSRSNSSDLAVSPCAEYSGGNQGKSELAPALVFDDGIWTYFKMTKNQNLDQTIRFPTVYRVVGNHESPANIRVVGGTIVAETISKIWVLRNGDEYLCIRSRDE